MELDTTKLRQAGFRKSVPHDNCVVLDIGSGLHPRIIEIRPPGDDGSRMTALWDGSLDLAVNDKVLAIEYAGNTIWRIQSMGGSDSGAGKVRVSKLWASDFSSESVVTDASDNVTVNTGTLTIPSDLIHGGDPDTLWSFTDDDVEITVGGLSMLKLTQTTQDLITLGPSSGDVDIDFNSDMFLQGSTGAFIIAATDPTFVLQGTTITSNFFVNRGTAGQRRTAVFSAVGSTQPENVFLKARAGPGAVADNDVIGNFFYCGHDGTDYNRSVRLFVEVEGTVSANTVPMAIIFQTSETNSAGLAQRLKIGSNGHTIIGAGSPLAQFHVDQSSTTAAVPTLFLDQGDISEQCIKFSSDSADRDINIFDIDVTGTPNMLWDESEDQLSWNKGFLVQGSFETDGERIVASETLTTTTSMADTVELAILNSGTAKTVTLPTHKADKLIRLTSIAAGVWTLSPTSGTIKGSASITLNNGEDVIVYSDGTNWV